MVTKSLEGTKIPTSIEWRYDKDIVIVDYDSSKPIEAELGQAITNMGYKYEILDSKSLPRDETKHGAWNAPLPEEAPTFFRESFTSAREKGRPIVIDFWAKWCGPCIQLKKVTFADAKVKSLLEKCQVIVVDLDENPQLGEFYGVMAVPDVFMIDRNGMVVDRFQNFEPPDAFVERLKALIGESNELHNGK